MGSHDYSDAKPAPKSYVSYFTLPGAGFASSSGNERFYDFVEGPVHFFVLDSNPQEPRGVTVLSAQAAWLRWALATSTSTWNVVVDHHPPFSSDAVHAPTTYMDWPFAEWGADAMISGHAHIYERVMHNGMPYFINGLGGGPRHALNATPSPESAVQFDTNWGAQKVVVTSQRLRFEFYTITGVLVDEYDVWRQGAALSVGGQIGLLWAHQQNAQPAKLQKGSEHGDDEPAGIPP